MADNIALAIDIGGSKFIIGYVDGGGNMLCSERYLWTELKPDSVIADIISAVERFQASHTEYSANVIGATIPGLADPEKGLWVESSFSGIRNIPIVSILNERFGLPVFIDNDSRACAAAEHRFGNCKGIDDFMWITVSNGIGGAIFSQGRPFRGFGNNAGEIGHVIVEEGPGARPCKCGLRGCAEMHASGRGVALNYISLGGGSDAEGNAPTAKSIDELARQGDATAILTYELEGLYLGRAIGAAVNLLNPQKVVIGGGVSIGFDLFSESLHNTLRTHIYYGANPKLVVDKTALGYHAALIGAATLGFIGEEQH